MKRDLPCESLTGVAAAIAAREVSSEEVVQSCIRMAERLDPQLHFLLWSEFEDAIAAARRADAMVVAGEPIGALHGVPLAHKDMFYRSGKPASGGSRIRQGFRPDYTATAVERIQQAGAIHLGGLAMVEFALGPHGYNQHLEQCRNPWAPSHIPCGSSSGSGVAVGARVIYGSLGSDTGGSIRCPAAANGVVGLLPSRGRVSRHGAMPMSFSLDGVGPLARTVRDCARLLQVIAGADPRDATSSHAPVPDYEAALERGVHGLRIGVPTSYFNEGVTPEVLDALERSVKVLESLGAHIIRLAVPDSVADICELHPLVMKAEGAANHANWMRERGQDYSEQVRKRLQAGFFIPATDYIQALQLRGPLLEEFMTVVFSQVDVLHTPVLPMPVPTIAETMPSNGEAYLTMVASLTRNTKIVNYLGLPAMSIPCGFVGNDLPVSFQLIGRPLDEATLLRAGHAYQSATDWHERVPSLVEAALHE